jgi:hypothetical protein
VTGQGFFVAGSGAFLMLALTLVSSAKIAVND